MTPAEVVDVLSKCTGFDQRTVGQVDVMAWHEVLSRTDAADALTAVAMHYAESRERAMPADIRKLAIVVRDTRQARERQAAGRLAIESAPTTADRSADVTALVRAVANALPKPDSYALARARAIKERGHAPPPPKTKRDLRKPQDYPAPSSDDIAALATRYLLDGHGPAAVAERLGVSRRWCERTLMRLRPDSASA